jgi:hypothetical protein
VGVAGDKGRWKSNLIGKCLREGAAWDDVTVSPVVRQTLLHWAYELTEADFNACKGRVLKRGAAYMRLPPGLQAAPRNSKRAASDDADEDTTVAAVQQRQHQGDARKRARHVDKRPDASGDPS